jgi:hypothetical protein
MKKLFLTGMLTLGLGLTYANANSAFEALDRHLVAIDYDIAGEGPGIGEYTEAKYQQSKTVRVATVSEPNHLEGILEEAFRSTRNCEGPYACYNI